jgi:HEAT repeat protein
VRSALLVLSAGLLAASAAPDERVAALIERLTSPNPGLRGMAAMELSEMGGAARDAVKPLAAALADEDLNVRYWAASALGAMGAEAKDAVPALMGALRTTVPDRGLQGPQRYYADVRSVCARALGLIGAPARMAVPALKEAQADTDGSVRTAATDALTRIGGN